MTRRDTTAYEKVRALFLATIMVVSVFGGTVAFAGSAAATGNSSSFAANVYAGGEVATISVTDTSEAGNDEKIEELEVTVVSSGDSETVTLEETAADSATFEGSIEVGVVETGEDIETDNGQIEGFAGEPIELDSYNAFAVLDAKAGAPSITDADVVGMRDGNTVVRVDFSEPVSSPSVDAFEFTGDAEVTQVTPGTAQDGYVELTFDREIQTGDADSELVVESGSYWDLAGVENTGSSEYVDSVELELDEGMNFVSAPFETGGVGFDAMKEKGLLDNVDVVWAYDQSSSGDGHWVSYDPDADENELEWFLGGQGYVFVAESSDEIDVRSYTKLADNDDSDNVPAVPQMEQIEPGWNLVGHYHEGTLPLEATENKPSAFGFGYDEAVGVLGQTDDGSMQYVGEADIGEAYWVFTRDYGLYTPKKKDGGLSTDTTSFNDVTVEPEDGDNLVTNDDTVKVTVDASDDDGIFHVYADASSLGTGIVDLSEAEDGTYTGTFDVSDQDREEDGVVVPVTVIDSYGDYQTDESGSIDLDASTSSPSLTDVSDQTVQTGTSIDVTYTADGSDTQSIEVAIVDGEGDDVVTTSGSTGTGVTTAITAPDHEGEYSVEVRATDDLDNTGASSQMALTVDDTAPSISNFAVTNPTGQTAEVSFDSDEQLSSITVSGTDDVASTTLSGVGDEGDFTEAENEDGSYTYTATLSEGADGTFGATLDAAADAADNDGAGTESDSVTIDTQANTASISASFDGSSDEITVTVSADEPIDTSTLAINLVDADGDVDESLTSWSDAGENTYEATHSVTESTEEEYAATLDTATDEAGNSMVADTPQSDTASVDTQVDVSSVSAAASSDTVTVTIEANEELNTGGLSADSIDGQSFSTFAEDTDDGDESIYTYTADATGVSDGDYDFEVSIEDTNSNTITESVSVTVDDVEPTASWTGYSDEDTISGTVNLEDQTDLTTDSTTTPTYEYQASGGTTWTEITEPASWDTSNAGDGDITLKVTVEDGQDNSDFAEVSVTVDNTDPSASVDSPSDGDTVQSQGTISGSASDGNEVASVELLISDGTDTWDDSQGAFTNEETTVEVATTSGSWSYSNTPSTDGSYDVTVTVTDAGDNTATDSVSYTIDTTVEATDLTATNPDSQNVQVVVTAEEQLTDLSASDGDSNTVSGVGDDGDFTETDNEDGTYTYTATYDAGADGDYTVTLDSASDANSNTDSSPSLDDTVSIDTQVDTQSVSAFASGDTVTVTIEANEQLNEGDLSAADIDGQSFSAFAEDTNDGDESIYTYTADATGVSDGDYTSEVSLKDANGNTDTATVSVTVDNVQPSASWSGYSGGETISGEVNLEDQTDLTTDSTTDVTYEYDDGSGFSEISSADSWDSTAANDGSVTLRVSVEDGQDNSDTDTVSVTVDNDADPTMDSATGTAGNNEVIVSFSEGVYANDDGSSGDLTSSDFTWNDGDGDGSAKTVDSVSHTAGESTATLTLSDNVDEGDLGSDSVELANAVYDSAGQSITASTQVTLTSS